MSSRGSRVDVMEGLQGLAWRRSVRRAERTRSGRMQIQTSVWAIAVVVSRELPEQPDQSPHQSLSDRIRLRRPGRGPDAGYTEVGQLGVEIAAVNVVLVLD